MTYSRGETENIVKRAEVFTYVIPHKSRFVIADWNRLVHHRGLQ